MDDVAGGEAPCLEMWHAMDDWLLRGVVSYLDDDDVYGLWVFAEETRLDLVCDGLAVSPVAPLSTPRALHYAMGHACWSAVYRLTRKPHKRHLNSRLVDGIIDEIQRQVTSPLHHHPYRKAAMMTAATPGSVPPFVMYFAVQQGNLESVIWLHSVARYDPTEALRIAARHGHDHVISWLLDNAGTAQWVNAGSTVEWAFRYEDDPELGVLAWRETHEDISTVLVFSSKWGFADVNKRDPADCGAVDLFVRHGDLASMERLLTYDVFQNNNLRRSVEQVASAGHLDILEWFYEHHPDVFVESELLIRAAAQGHLHMIQWAIARTGDRQDEAQRAISAAVLNGHLSVLEWLVDTFPDSVAEFHLHVVCYGGGHVDIAQWLVEKQGFSVSRHMLLHAAIQGHRQLFQFCLGCLQKDSGDDFRWDPMWLDAAAESGNLAFVRWLVESCSLWSPSAVAKATGPEVVDYLHASAVLRGREHGDISSVEFAATIRRGAYDTIACLLKHGLYANQFDKK